MAVPGRYEPDTTGPMPGAVIGSILADARMLAGRTDAILAPIASGRAELREKLKEAGEIIDIGPALPINTRSPLTVACVDGGSVTEKLYAADLLVAAAVSASGMHGGNLPLPHSTWTHIERHTGDLDRLTGAAMVAQELRVLAELEHDIRIFDGAHGTPVIGLTSGLIVRNTKVRDMVVDLYQQWDIPTALNEFVAPDRSNGRVLLALPKADSSSHFTDQYAKRFSIDLDAGDRFLAAQVLEPGEMLLPRVADEYKGLFLSGPGEAPAHVQVMVERLNDALEPLRDQAKSGVLQVTYVKPESADTVIKVEFLDGDGLVTIKRIGRILSDETPGPHLQEPFAQHMADLAAKSVSSATQAVSQAMLGFLPESAESYLQYLARSYRTTTGKTGKAGPGGA